MGEPDALVISMKEMIREVERDFDREEPCTIYKVLETIRAEDQQAYDPKIVSIGPFHHGKESLATMEQLKRRFLRDIVARHSDNSVDKYIEKVRSLEREARMCYSELNIGSNDFVKMMVLDGCFIVEFLLKLYQGKCKGHLYSVNWNMPLLRNDLLLLENQIPFLVLECLFDSTIVPDLIVKDDDDDDDDDEDYYISLTDIAVPYLSKIEDPAIPDVVHHLLHLEHSTLKPFSRQAQPAMQMGQPMKSKIKHLIFRFFFWLMSLLLSCRRPSRPKPSQKAPRTTPSATELDEAGVKFKRKKHAGCFLDVTFRVGDGTMEIPLLSIQAATISRFRNLVAFEQCFPKAGSHFTSYVALMDNLIDTPEDVALLERSGVLESKLGGDEEVARFFNNLGKGAYMDYENHYLVELFKDVKKYCATGRHRWRARMVHDYFSNPWSIVSLIAAFVLLVLTVVQTFFAVFAYFRPP